VYRYVTPARAIGPQDLMLIAMPVSNLVALHQWRPEKPRAKRRPNGALRQPGVCVRPGVPINKYCVDIRLSQHKIMALVPASCAIAGPAFPAHRPIRERP
jgi:hypothetical protein